MSRMRGVLPPVVGEHDREYDWSWCKKKKEFAVETILRQERSLTCG